MQKYVDQLAGQLRGARSLPLTPPYVELDPEFADVDAIRGAEEFLAGPTDTLEALLKINREAFPPDDRLSDAQVNLLVDEILALWLAHNFVADLPDGITPRDAYNALLRRWNDEPVSYVSSGHYHLEFWDDPELAHYYPADDEP